MNWADICCHGLIFPRRLGHLCSAASPAGDVLRNWRVCASYRMTSSTVSDLTCHLVNPITYVQRHWLSHWIYAALLFKPSPHTLHILQQRETNTSIVMLQNGANVLQQHCFGLSMVPLVIMIHSLIVLPLWAHKCQTELQLLWSRTKRAFMPIKRDQKVSSIWEWLIMIQGLSTPIQVEKNDL